MASLASIEEQLNSLSKQTPVVGKRKKASGDKGVIHPVLKEKKKKGKSALLLKRIPRHTLVGGILSSLHPQQTVTVKQTPGQILTAGQLTELGGPSVQGVEGGQVPTTLHQEVKINADITPSFQVVSDIVQALSEVHPSNYDADDIYIFVFQQDMDRNGEKYNVIAAIEDEQALDIMPFDLEDAASLVRSNIAGSTSGGLTGLLFSAAELNDTGGVVGPNGLPAVTAGQQNLPIRADFEQPTFFSAGRKGGSDLKKVLASRARKGVGRTTADDLVGLLHGFVKHPTKDVHSYSPVKPGNPASMLRMQQEAAIRRPKISHRLVPAKKKLGVLPELGATIGGALDSVFGTDGVFGGIGSVLGTIGSVFTGGLL